MTLVTFRARDALSGPLAGPNNSHASDALGGATAAEIRARVPDPPSYSAVRAHLCVVEEKGHVRHESRDLRYVYQPTLRPEHARLCALRRMLNTFFGGSVERLVAALLDEKSARLSLEELERLSALVERARKEKS
ncbi:MAG: BlaI/MecI/CopY family transcriptional regulator [Bryobacteraceae bacterium]